MREKYLQLSDRDDPAHSSPATSGVVLHLFVFFGRSSHFSGFYYLPFVIGWMRLRWRCPLLYIFVIIIILLSYYLIILYLPLERKRPRRDFKYFATVSVLLLIALLSRRFFIYVRKTKSFVADQKPSSFQLKVVRELHSFFCKNHFMRTVNEISLRIFR